jgi:hypothetical protein
MKYLYSTFKHEIGNQTFKHKMCADIFSRISDYYFRKIESKVCKKEKR